MLRAGNMKTGRYGTVRVLFVPAGRQLHHEQIVLRKKQFCAVYVSDGYCTQPFCCMLRVPRLYNGPPSPYEKWGQSSERELSLSLCLFLISHARVRGQCPARLILHMTTLKIFSKENKL
jgi:hypothetical protein